MPKAKAAVIFGFEIVPIEDVPTRKKVVYPPDDQHGSEYDRMLRALVDNPEGAVKIISRNSVPLMDLTHRQRRGIQSGLITISKNGRVHNLRTKVEADAVYAYLEEIE
jgi:hypothetical protein